MLYTRGFVLDRFHFILLFQDLNSINPGTFIGIKLNLHITMLLHAKYNCIYILGS